MKVPLVITVFILMQICSANIDRDMDCICISSLSIELFETAYEREIIISNNPDALKNKAILTECSSKISGQITVIQKSIKKTNVDIGSQLIELNVHIQIQLGKVFTLVQSLASLYPSIIGKIDISIGELNLRLVTLINSCKIIQDQGATKETWKALDCSFASIGDSLLTLIDFAVNITHGLNSSSSLVVNLEQVLETIIVSVSGIANLSKELLIRVKLNISSTLTKLCKSLETATNLIRQKKQIISVCVDFSTQLAVDVDIVDFIPLIEKVLRSIEISITKFNITLKLNEVNETSIVKLQTNAVTLLQMLQKIVELHVDLNISTTENYTLQASLSHVIISINSLIIYLNDLCTSVRPGISATINLKHITKQIAVILLDVTENYGVFLDISYQISTSYIVRILRNTDLRQVNQIYVQLDCIGDKLGVIGSNLQNLIKSVLNVIDSAIRPAVTVALTQQKYCCEPIKELSSNIRELLKDVGVTNTFRFRLSRLHFGSGSSAIGPLSICSAKIAWIFDASNKYSTKVTNIVKSLKCKAECSC